MGRKFGFSFSWKRASGLSAAKGRLLRNIVIPLTRSGRQRKVGRMKTGCKDLFGMLCFVLATVPGLFALIGFMVDDTGEGRVVAGVLGGLALLLFVIGVYALGHQGPRDLTLSSPANSPSTRPRTGLRYDVVRGIFVREEDLENFIVRNWDRLDFGTPLEFIGQQVPCAHLGIINVLARDRVTRDYVVIELKKEEADDVVFGQLSRYMGGIERYRAKIEGVGVRGIIVAHTISSRLRAAASVNPKVGLRQYVCLSKGQSSASLSRRLHCSPGDLILLPGTGH